MRPSQARQLNQARSPEALGALVLDATRQLCNPRRTLLVLESPAGLQIAKSKLPRGETAPGLLSAVTPWLNAAREDGSAALHIGPAGAVPKEQRCCIVAPLIGTHATLGFLYCDVDGRFGRWGEAERNGLALLAALAAAALDNAQRVHRLDLQVEQRTRELADARDQQSATAEVLRIIGSSPSDLEPVYRTILESITRLCESHIGALFVFDGERLGAAATHGTTPEFAEVLQHSRPKPSRETTTRLAALERRTVHVVDLLHDPNFSPTPRELWERENVRTVLSVPMLKQNTLIGVITTWRREVRPFDERQIGLIRTFADQAVIAIENARLFNETRQALEQQQASGEVLRTISGSIADTQPVFDKILESCERLFNGKQIGINLVAGDAQIHVAAYHGPGRDEFLRLSPFPPGDASGSGSAIANRRVMHYPDAQDGPDVPPSTRRGCATIGVKSVIFAPLLWEGRGIGVIFVGRDALGPFSDKDIALLQSFADQAVIAIQNARLFTDTKDALARQTATAGVLKVINQSTFDLSRILNILVENATRQCDASHGFIFRPEGEVYRLAVSFGATPEFEAHIAGIPVRPERGYLIGRVVLERQPVQILDAAADPDYQQAESRRLGGYRTMLGVPMLRAGEVVGAIVVWRLEVRAFTDKQVDALMSFADQAAIAIGNVQLFDETQEALERQTATAEILRVISDSPTDVAPVFDAIAERAHVLCRARTGATLHFDGEMLQVAAYRGVEPEGDAALRAAFPAKPSRKTVAGRCILERGVVQVADVQLDAEYELNDAAQAGHFRSVLAVPMMQGARPIGVIVVTRERPGAFADRSIALLQTFADQAVIAIQNVRLFNETKEALEQQKASAGILRVISESPTDVAPVFEAIVQAGVQLFEDAAVAVCQPEGGQVRLRAIAERDPQRRQRWHERFPFPLTREYMHGAALLDGRPIDIPDALDPALPYEIRSAQLRTQRLPRDDGRADAARGRCDRCDQRHPHGPRPPVGQADRHAPDLRRPGRDRRRERAAVQRDQGGAGAADRNRRNPESDREFAARRAAGVRRDRGEFEAPHRRLFDDGIPHHRRRVESGGVHAHD